MNTAALFVPLLLVANTALAEIVNPPSSSRADAHAMAAALLSGSHAFRTQPLRSVGPATQVAVRWRDAHQQAAALLSSQTRHAAQAPSLEGTARVRAKVDAHAQAAALLRGSRVTG